MEWQTTSTILSGLRDDENQAAWRRLDERFRRPVVAFAQRLGLSQADAEDVGQETLVEFASAYRKGHFDPAKGRLSRWLFGIAFRQTLNARRSRKRDRARGETPDQPTAFWANVVDEQSASICWDEEWERALLQRCLAQVEREVEAVTLQAFQLVVCQAWEPSKAARHLKVPIKSVYNAKHRVLKRIRELRSAMECIS